MEIVDLAGESEGSVEAAAGIYIDGEPASDPIDLTADPGTTGEIGIEDEEEAEAKPKAKKRKAKASASKVYVYSTKEFRNAT